MATQLVTAATTYPVTLDEVKAQLRIDHNNSDSELTAMIKQATQYVESQTGFKLITQTWSYTLDCFDTEIKLPYPPLQSVSSIVYNDESGSQQTLGSANYTVDAISKPARLYQSSSGTYPTTIDDINAVTITFVCGYGNASKVPEHFKQMIKLYIQWMYDLDPDSEAVLDRLIMQYKIPWTNYNA